ncbi:MAG: carboxylesterase/lipase family protein [Hyphomicrobiales bacterium]|nr:MAG: carboxylesterase/lipase family protein [Hyphomicrobiales bacterium]
MERRTFLRTALGAGLTVASSTWSGAQADDAIVATKWGQLRGRREDGAYSFKGIAYAASPTGMARFQPPQPPHPWSGIRDALEFGPKPPQANYPPVVAALIPPELTPMGDDCLTLNVWTPQLHSGGLPVMVWVPGGPYEYHATSASPWYDGRAFARDGVVLVSINYRIGAAGFLYLHDGIANLGLLDQVAALEWVRDNIAEFGGDPAKVTIFGESAGGLAVGTLLAVPKARGLFSRAIVESGGGQHVSSPATAERIGRRFADLAGVSFDRGAIAALSSARIIDAQNALRGELQGNPDPALWGEVLGTNLPWQPTVDGEVVPELPLEAVRKGASKDVTLLAGSNTEEWRLFLVPGNVIDQIPLAAVVATLTGLGLDPNSALKAYQDLRPGASPGDLFAAVMTDWYWRIPALRLAQAHAAQGGPGGTFAYEFAWRSPQFGGPLGACHAIEIPFVFDTLGPSSQPLLGEAPPQELARTMHRAWIDFAVTGHPGWEPFEARRRMAMRFDTTSGAVGDLLIAEEAIWGSAR